MTDLRQAAEQALEALRYTTDHLPAKTGVERHVDEAITALQIALAQPEREWVGLNSFDRTLLRTTYAPLKTLHHIKETDTDIVAEVVNDWEAFFTAIEEVLKEKNT